MGLSAPLELDEPTDNWGFDIFPIAKNMGIQKKYIIYIGVYREIM